MVGFDIHLMIMVVIIDISAYGCITIYSFCCFVPDLGGSVIKRIPRMLLGFMEPVKKARTATSSVRPNVVR